MNQWKGHFFTRTGYYGTTTKLDIPWLFNVRQDRYESYDQAPGPRANLVIMEIPPASGGAIVGTIMDAWQTPLEDVGPAGADKGQGGKYLILPPGYTAKVPDGYIVLPSLTYKGYALLRSIRQSGSDEDLAKAVDRPPPGR